MSKLTITKSYSDDQVLTRQQILDATGSIESYFNSRSISGNQLKNDSLDTSKLDTSFYNTDIFEVSGDKLQLKDDSLDDRELGLPTFSGSISWNKFKPLEEASVTLTTGTGGSVTNNIRTHNVSADEFAFESMHTVNVEDSFDVDMDASVELSFTTTSGSTFEPRIEITTNGGPVMIILAPSASYYATTGSPSYMEMEATGFGGTGALREEFWIDLHRDGDKIATNHIHFDRVLQTYTADSSPGSVIFLDNPSAGTYTYSMRYREKDRTIGAETAQNFRGLDLIAYELI